MGLCRDRTFHLLTCITTSFVFKSHVNDDTHLHVGSMNYTSRYPGLSGGLAVALRVNQHDYMYANSPSAGFRVSAILPMHV